MIRKIKILKNLAICMILLTILNGCYPGMALLGPAFSYTKTNSVLQSALSFGSNKAVRSIVQNKENSSSSGYTNKTLKDYLLEKDKKKITVK